MIIILEQVLKPEEIKIIRQKLETAEWEDGKKTAGYLAQEVKENLQLSPQSPLALELGNFLKQVLRADPGFIAAALPAKILPPRFNRYEDSGSYGNHIDNSIFNLPDTQGIMRTDVSSTIFFSEPEEYEGGELIIEDTYGTHSVKLKAGDMVVYPGDSLHRVEPVTQGIRFASFFWTQSMIRHAHRRRLLWQLDQSIQRLSMQDDGLSEATALSGIYHNLIREWAEV
ncbi:PKHD-type hydroxylase Sbal_3634 [Oligella ureolytica]|uniref:Fe2+-dependent dioxygenase n=1 Tax=Oligella ureolytica TaxID=90244 RepID=A0A378XH18_9BURK|nr:Fe2+-dependent dioxygenase [Oligella ureolytica]QPT39553.1 Fe2+-dependent dioxygenase [Oligella ureolytica]SUA56657.1 PKHD-type hydroxylase Sbal_3634 [Oligella ureolytica]